MVQRLLMYAEHSISKRTDVGFAASDGSPTGIAVTM